MTRRGPRPRLWAGHDRKGKKVSFRRPLRTIFPPDSRSLSTCLTVLFLSPSEKYDVAHLSLCFVRSLLIIRMQFGEESVVHIGHRSEEESRHEKDDAAPIAVGLCVLSDSVRGGAGHGGCHLQQPHSEQHDGDRHTSGHNRFRNRGGRRLLSEIADIHQWGILHWPDCPWLGRRPQCFPGGRGNLPRLSPGFERCADAK